MTSRTAGLAAGIVGALVVAGCSTTVDGHAVPASGHGPGASPEYAALLTECDAVPPEQIAEAVGGGAIERGFFGAICRWTVNGPAGPVRVTFNWFETGSVDVERDTSERLDYAVEDVTVDGRRAVLSRPPLDPGACGIATSSPVSGVLGWWVQYRGAEYPDPCETAITLAKSALQLSA